MPITGERPGKGIYYCKNCGQKLVLKKSSELLPFCPSCGNTEFIKT